VATWRAEGGAPAAQPRRGCSRYRIVFRVRARRAAPADAHESTVRPFVFIITVFGFRMTATNPYNAENAIKRKPAITGGGEGATAGQRRAYRAETNQV